MFTVSGKLLLTLSFAAALCVNVRKASAQSPKALQETIVSLDTDLFRAVNTCDLPKLAIFWADDAEFPP